MSTRFDSNIFVFVIVNPIAAAAAATASSALGMPVVDSLLAFVSRPLRDRFKKCFYFVTFWLRLPLSFLHSHACVSACLRLSLLFIHRIIFIIHFE